MDIRTGGIVQYLREKLLAFNLDLAECARF
jgi:hypothetical protein